MRNGGVVGAFLVMAAMLCACGSEENPDDSGTAEFTNLQYPTTPTTTAEPVLTLDPDLVEAGVTEELLQQLHTVASSTNYGLKRDAPIPRDILQAVGMTMVDRCREIASGAETWERAVELDISTGATRSDSTDMNRFLRTIFCPAVR
ncbi:hypothetical protein [Nocardia sp. NPDC057272]|uniref:hypothetical protein n=1 Tax=Nocardia sp. NPDC057272 TaxID=3346079 RepID=UPI00362E0DCB